MAGMEVKREINQKHRIEKVSIITGIVLLFSTIFFFLLKLGIIQIKAQISDGFFLYLFATVGLISGVIHIASTIGTFSTR